MAARAPHPRFARVARFFRRHPVLLLLAFTPGIPEYLSGSSVVYPVLTSPLGFLFFLGLNLGLYGPDVLLLREAWVRRGRSWGSLLCLGAAYGLLEEGTALATLFNPKAAVVGALGSYGRFAGVNWVWMIGVLGVHIVLSVGLPILLLGLALPEIRGRSLLSRREVAVASAVYLGDLAILAALSEDYRVDLVGILGAAIVALHLWGLAYRLPRGLIDPPRTAPRWGPHPFFFLGLAFLPILLLTPVVGGDLSLPALVTGGIDLGLATALFFAIRQSIGRARNGPHRLLLALGATLPIVAIGLVAQIAIPIVLVLDAVYGVFFYVLWERYRPPGISSSRPVVPSAS
jgi:hypothetical protein